jgi:nicotinate-nucleotide adenylyltransferase
MKIGLLGGSFNPIHLAHVRMAMAAREALRLETVLFIPARLPPHKQLASLAPEADRIEMARLAVAGEESFRVSEVEMRRPGASYTIDTVTALRSEFGPAAEFHFLIGADTLLELPTWREITRLATLCRFVPVVRPGVPEAAPAALAEAVGEAEARAILARTVRMPPLDISSSDIRRRVAEGRPISDRVPKAVEEYILRKGLYRR